MQAVESYTWLSPESPATVRDVVLLALGDDARVVLAHDPAHAVGDAVHDAPLHLAAGNTFVVSFCLFASGLVIVFE